MQRIELVGVARQQLARDRVFQPLPLEHRGLEHRRRRVGVVFEQLRRTLAVVSQVEAAVEARIAALPARRDPVPERRRNLEDAQQSIVGNCALDQRAAHLVELRGRRLDIALDLLERERVIGALVPIAFAVDGVEREAGSLSDVAPVGALVTGDAPHGRSTGARRRMAGAAETATRGAAGGAGPGRRRRGNRSRCRCCRRDRSRRRRSCGPREPAGATNCWCCWSGSNRNSRRTRSAAACSLPDPLRRAWRELRPRAGCRPADRSAGPSRKPRRRHRLRPSAARRLEKSVSRCRHQVMEAALNTPAVTDASPNQIAAAISPFSIRSDSWGTAMRAT